MGIRIITIFISLFGLSLITTTALSGTSDDQTQEGQKRIAAAACEEHLGSASTVHKKEARRKQARKFINALLLIEAAQLEKAFKDSIPHQLDATLTAQSEQGELLFESSEDRDQELIAALKTEITSKPAFATLNTNCSSHISVKSRNLVIHSEKNQPSETNSMS